MQLDYKDIIIKHYALSMSGSEIARQTGFSKSGVNDFLRAFKKCNRCIGLPDKSASVQTYCKRTDRCDRDDCIFTWRFGGYAAYDFTF